MNADRSHSIFSRFLTVLASQGIVFLSGIIKALLIPVLLGPSDFGLWQIYIFYTVYIGLFTLGYGDGLYLKYGGRAFADLPFRALRVANIFYILVLVTGAVAVSGAALAQPAPERQFVYLAVAANILILGITAIVSLSLQATNEMKGYAIINSADKVFFSVALIALVYHQFRNPEYLIAADLLAKLCVLAWLLWRYRQLFVGTFARLSDGVTEFSSSVGAGVQLLIANLSGMLVLGVGRIIVEYQGAIESYAFYAFAISLANVVLVSITALSIVLYPTLRQIPRGDLLPFYNRTTGAYSLFSILLLTAYFPAVIFVEWVATDYRPVLAFLNVVFVTIVLQGKMQLANNTYYKALRLERAMLSANLSSLALVTLLSLLGYWLTGSVVAIAYATLAAMLLRVYASELSLRKAMGEAFSLKPLLEIAILAGFLLITLTAPPAIAASIWVALMVGFAAMQRHALSTMLQPFRGRV